MNTGEKNLSVPAAYLGVVLIWTTTPLTIKWSGAGSHFLFGVTARMVIGMLLAYVCLWALRTSFPLDRRSLHTYLASGLGIFGGMTLVYWSAQFIPSGWISVIFGLNPIITGILATFFLEERGMTLARLAGAILGVIGLLVIFGKGAAVGGQALQGILGVLTATTIHCGSAVWVKRVSTGVPALAVTAGGVSVTVFLLSFTWLLSGLGWPQQVTMKAGLSIVYLGVFGSVVGFALYFFVLKRVAATKVALITLITPVSALYLGHLLGGEELSASVWYGTALILFGLLVFEFGDRRFSLRRLAGRA